MKIYVAKKNKDGTYDTPQEKNIRLFPRGDGKSHTHLIEEISKEFNIPPSVLIKDLEDIEWRKSLRKQIQAYTKCFSKMINKLFKL